MRLAPPRGLATHSPNRVCRPKSSGQQFEFECVERIVLKKLGKITRTLGRGMASLKEMTAPSPDT